MRGSRRKRHESRIARRFAALHPGYAAYLPSTRCANELSISVSSLSAAGMWKNLRAPAMPSPLEEAQQSAETPRRRTPKRRGASRR